MVVTIPINFLVILFSLYVHPDTENSVLATMPNIFHRILIFSCSKCAKPAKRFVLSKTISAKRSSRQEQSSSDKIFRVFALKIKEKNATLFQNVKFFEKVLLSSLDAVLTTLPNKIWWKWNVFLLKSKTIEKKIVFLKKNHPNCSYRHVYCSFDTTVDTFLTKVTSFLVFVPKKLKTPSKSYFWKTYFLYIIFCRRKMDF